ncbi:hypothetical protein JN00_0105 [Metamycoplasma subdolum]|uniref:Lipoprotein n=1 Tax=Metamycoplasma subdolum TaxID=92407 RepID=A0A3M0A8A2_9BACT|nr:hypothetical protein [Metamycoplasma subdolum]RMA79058.1 hypothetical protein JN00_0105 [Metamycoplasma subdolum]WPB50581.1 hypothetical protein R9C05_00245 [Metamycoplasma subdolum]
MKIRKSLILATMTILPSVALVSASCGEKTPKLDELKELVKNSSVEKLLEGVEQVETPSKPEELEKGKKQVSTAAVKTYEAALDVASKVTEESKAEEAATTLKAAIEALKATIVEGTKEATPSTTPKLDALKELIKNSSVAKLLEGVDQVDSPKKPEEIQKGKKEVAKSEVKTYEAALDVATKVTEEAKAEEATKTLQAAIDALKAKIVVGTKE